MNGIELIDREFVTAIEEGREPNASVSQVLPCYETLDLLDRKLSLQTDTSDPTRGKPARR
jgi:2-hydroxy-4-carboxymuconate semialdehyde hemiacetal dehydrogenase